MSHWSRWLGNENEHKLPNGTDNTKLTIRGFQGNTYNGMPYHNGVYFTTKDSENDVSAL